MTDADLNALFAEKVAGWIVRKSGTLHRHR